MKHLPQRVVSYYVPINLLDDEIERRGRKRRKKGGSGRRGKETANGDNGTTDEGKAQRHNDREDAQQDHGAGGHAGRDQAGQRAGQQKKTKDLSGELQAQSLTVP